MNCLGLSCVFKSSQFAILSHILKVINWRGTVQSDIFIQGCNFWISQGNCEFRSKLKFAIEELLDRDCECKTAYLLFVTRPAIDVYIRTVKRAIVFALSPKFLDWRLKKSRYRLPKGSYTIDSSLSKSVIFTWMIQGILAASTPNESICISSS